MPEVLYEEVVEVEERVVLEQDSCQLGLPGPVTTGTTGEKVQYHSLTLTPLCACNIQTAHCCVLRFMCGRDLTGRSCELHCRKYSPKESAVWPSSSCIHTRNST